MTEDPATSRRRRGRPQVIPHDVRRRVILSAAEAVFSSNGYAGASMSEIARRAGMSKKTVYALFPNKKSLFDAFAEDLDALEQTVGEIGAEPDIEDLVDILRNTALFALSPRQLQATGLLIAERHNDAELAARFYERVIRRVQERHAALITMIAARNGRDISEPLELARQLFGLVMGDLHIRALLGKRPEDAELLIEKHLDMVRTCAALFIGPAPGAKAAPGQVAASG